MKQIMEERIKMSEERSNHLFNMNDEEGKEFVKDAGNLGIVLSVIGIALSLIFLIIDGVNEISLISIFVGVIIMVIIYLLSKRGGE